jgi:hypothetical protein
MAADGFQCIAVNPATVSFEKSAYPAVGSEVAQFSPSVQDPTKRGMWYIRLRVEKKAKSTWEVKGSLRPLTHEGYVC